MNKFEIFLHKSEELRNGYIKSMELPDKDFEHKWQECFSYIPVFLMKYIKFVMEQGMILQNRNFLIFYRDTD